MGVEAGAHVVVFVGFNLRDLIPAAHGATDPPNGRGREDVADEPVVDAEVLRDPVAGGGEGAAPPDGGVDVGAGQADVAVPILEKVAQQAPWAAEPLLLLYEAQVSQGKLDEAEQSLVQAAEINPRYFAQLAQFYERQGKWEDSAAAYEEAISSARQPSRDLQIRYAAALINMDGGAAKARQVAGVCALRFSGRSRVTVTTGSPAGPDQVAETPPAARASARSTVLRTRPSPSCRGSLPRVRAA